MADIDIVRYHSLGRTRARERAAQVLQGRGILGTWKGDVFHVSSTMAAGHMTVTDGNIEIHLNLSPIARAMKPMIEMQIQQAVADAVAA